MCFFLNPSRPSSRKKRLLLFFSIQISNFLIKHAWRNYFKIFTQSTKPSPNFLGKTTQKRPFNRTSPKKPYKNSKIPSKPTRITDNPLFNVNNIIKWEFV